MINTGHHRLPTKAITVTPANDRTLPLNLGPPKGRNRRILPVAVGPDEGPLTETEFRGSREFLRARMREKRAELSG